MSRFIPLHRAPPPQPSFQFPAPPPSPPETELTTEPRSVNERPPRVPSLDISSLESPASRFRRVSSIAYHQSGLRDARPPSRETRTVKWLLVVVPPKSLNREPTALGHTLSTGPVGRFSSGIIMPLFPTLYGQLTAIAREFNMPSTTGVCLYFHIPNASGLVTPRISDDSWPLLWAHLLDESLAPTSTTLTGPPIGGTIEFDIDVRKARWIDTWMGVPRVSSESDGLHRNLSLSTNKTMEETETPNPKETVRRARAHSQTNRRVPRPLSLVERNSDAFDVSRDGPSARGQFEVPTVSMLSPVPQSAVPPIIQENDLVNRVTNWREVTSISPAVHPLVSSGQFSLDPTNMPNSAPHSPIMVPSVSADADTPDSIPDIAYELDLNDFQWSISSIGPQTPVTEEYIWPSPLPSIHLLGRAQGSVCLSPSVATSFGPDSEYADFDNLSNTDRLPSPDLAYRALSDAPLSASTATSWGPASWAEPDDYDVVDETLSIDIAHRGRWSQPNTPTTATSWGAPDVYPPSPFLDSPIRTPDLAERAFGQSLGHPVEPYHFPSFPYYSAWSAPPWKHVWPYTKLPRSNHLENSTAGASASVETRAVSTIASQARTNPQSFPYYNSWKKQPWPHVWPYSTPIEQLTEALDEKTGWLFVWPYNRAPENVPSTTANSSTSQPFSYPFITIYQPVYPYISLYPAPSASTEDLLPEIPGDYGDYPFITIYKPAYPHLEIYPERQKLRDSTGTLDYGAYPLTTIYKPVYPHLEIYPGPAVKMPTLVASDYGKYPFITIYRPVYPNLEMYPPASLVMDDKPKPVAHERNDYSHLTSGNAASHLRHYPAVIPYVPVYPWIEPYPPIAKSVDTIELDLPILTRLAASVAGYPHLEVYPAIFGLISSAILPLPQFLANPDHDTEAALARIGSMSRSHYPCVEPYPSVYPHIHPYRSNKGTGSRNPGAKDSTHNWLGGSYPYFYIYPPTYPNVSPYPGLAGASSTKVAASLEAVTVAQTLDTQHLIPPPAVPSVQAGLVNVFPSGRPYGWSYPHLDIYPAMGTSVSQRLPANPCTVDFRYPYLVIYPKVYPFLDPYPQANVKRRKTHAELRSIVMDLKGQSLVEHQVRTPRVDSQKTTGSAWSTISRGVAERARAFAERVEQSHAPQVRKVARLDRTKLKSILQ